MGVIHGYELVPGVDGMVVDKCRCNFDGAEVTVDAVAFAVVDVELENGLFGSDIAVPFAGGYRDDRIWADKSWEVEWKKGQRQG